MQSNPHAKAQELIDRAPVEGISPQEQTWLDTHLTACAECSEYAATAERTIAALGKFAFELDHDAAFRVQANVRRRVVEIRPAAWEARNFWLVNGAAILLTAGGSMAVWEAGEWASRAWSLPAWAWQTAFVMGWAVPSMMLCILLLFRGLLLGNQDGKGGSVL
ncbi:MAG TPA: hypothetical protein VHW24_09980 [Bryobacteraceae bacterium]|nr:hypothetical protein [Bryobacteraceae bacterium]